VELTRRQLLAGAGATTLAAVGIYELAERAGRAPSRPVVTSRPPEQHENGVALRELRSERSEDIAPVVPNRRGGDEHDATRAPDAAQKGMGARHDALRLAWIALQGGHAKCDGLHPLPHDPDRVVDPAADDFAASCLFLSRFS
jgi:hypothetical protein